MRYILIPLFYLATTCSIYSQLEKTSESSIAPLGSITYVYKSYLLNGGFITRDAVLLFNDNESLFYHSKGEAPVFNLNGMDCKEGCYPVDETGDLVYKNFNSDTLELREIAYFQPYISREKIPKIEWKITNDTKQIGSFKCQKATAYFRGRNYVAWFTTKIPISDGPWKFSGLPGMILEATSDDEQYAFIFKSIQMPLSLDNKEQITFTDKGLNVNFETFKEADSLEFEKIKKKNEAKWLSAGGEPGGFKMTRTVPEPIELTYDDKEN